MICIQIIERIAAKVDCPIIACGGISSAENVRDFQHAGAQIIGIGSALIGMTTDEIATYFKVLTRDMSSGENNAESLVQYDVDMDFSPVTLVKNERLTEDISILTFDRKVNIQAGEFVFLWIPGVGEKPFSALVDDPFKLVVINLGIFYWNFNSTRTWHRSFCSRSLWNSCVTR